MSRLTVKKDGKVFQLAQSRAVERYVAKQTGLMGKSDEEAALIDSIGELVSDLKTKYNAAKADHVQLTKFVNEVLPLQLSFVEKFIDVYGSGYAIGSSVSLADIQLYFVLTTFLPADLKVTEIISDKIALLITQVGSIPGVAKWVAGRPARNEPF
jgi:glutathione S-transferase